MFKSAKKYFFAFGFLFFLTFISVFSQDSFVKATASIDTNHVLIGDQIKLLLKVNYPNDVKLTFPSFKDSIGRLLIIKESKIDTIKDEKGISLSQKLTLTSFDSGSYELPPLRFDFNKSGDTLQQSVYTNASYVKFFSVPIDTSKPIKDIKPPLDLPFSIWDYIWYILGFVGFIVLGLGLFYLLYQRKPKLKEIQRFDPKIPAHIQALSDLEKLESEKLWQAGMVKEYHTRLTDILRFYLERRFEFPAMESTSAEIMNSIQEIISGVSVLQNLQYILETADLVKFAKSLPLPDENARVMYLAKNIIESTIPIEIEPENGGQSNG
jgi:hypothetical protein